jgi:hypothetical protein
MHVEELVARAEIQDVLWTYARGVDRADFEAMASVYHPEATDTHSAFDGPGVEFARQLTNRERVLPAVGQHHITNIVFDFLGADNARVESYFLAFHPHEEAEQMRLAIAAGRYLDHFQRRAGQWKILSRKVVMDWTREHVDGTPWSHSDGLPVQGSRKALGDASYAFFAGG